MMRWGAGWRAVASSAPVRHRGEVGSLLTRPSGPNIWRPRSEGAEYLIVIDLPPRVTEVCAEGLCGLPAKSAEQVSSVAGIRMDLLMNRVYRGNHSHGPMDSQTEAGAPLGLPRGGGGGSACRGGVRPRAGSRFL